LLSAIVIEIKKEKDIVIVDTRPVEEKDFRQIVDIFSEFALFDKVKGKMV
jgi:hypothetical protein